MSVNDVSANELIAAAAEELKKIPDIKPPEWLMTVKAGSHNERLPEQEDFWYHRCAAILRAAATIGRPIGVQRLRNKFGGRTQHIVSRSHHRKAGGKNIRLAMQQLEKAGLLKKEKAGRTITAKGQQLLDKAVKAPSHG